MKQYSKINLKIVLNASVRLLIFVVALSCLMIGFRIFKVNSIEESIDKQHVYYKLQQESSPFSVSLDQYIELYEQLSNNSRYKYYEYYRQYLERLPVSQKFFNYENEILTENCPAALCIQIGENMQRDNHLKCQSGRLLNNEDYQYSGDAIPVVLGYEYRDLFPIGFQFSATYLYNIYTFEVVGILEKNSQICNQVINVCLDKYIIMPSFNVEKLPENIDGISIHYANKTSGLLISQKNDFSYVSEYLRQLLADAECGEYSVDISPIKYYIEEKWGISIEGLLLFLSLIAVICGILYVKYVQKQRKYIKEKMLLFTCVEMAGSVLLFVAVEKVLSSLFLLEISIKLFLIFEIFIIIIRNTILRFCNNI